MECQKCQGGGFVCDDCGEASGVWQSCEACGGDFCSPLRIKCGEYSDHPAEQCDGSGVHLIGLDHFAGHVCEARS